MTIMINKWGGDVPDEDDRGTDDDGEGEPSGGHDAGDAAEIEEAPALDIGDPYMLPDGQVLIPFSDDEDDVRAEPHEMPVFGDGRVPTPNNQEPAEMPVLGDYGVPPDNQEPEMPVLGDYGVPTPDNQELQMPVLGDGVPALDNQEPAEMPKLGDGVPALDNQEPAEMPKLGDGVPTRINQEPEMPVLGDGVPTPDSQPEMPVLGDGVPTRTNQEPAGMPVLGDGVPTPDNQEPAEMPKLGDPSKVLRGHDLAMVATPCVNGKPPPFRGGRILQVQPGILRSLHQNPGDRKCPSQISRPNWHAWPSLGISSEIIYRMCAVFPYPFCLQWCKLRKIPSSWLHADRLQS